MADTKVIEDRPDIIHIECIGDSQDGCLIYVSADNPDGQHFHIRTHPISHDCCVYVFHKAWQQAFFLKRCDIHHIVHFPE